MLHLDLLEKAPALLEQLDDGARPLLEHVLALETLGDVVLDHVEERLVEPTGGIDGAQRVLRREAVRRAVRAPGLPVLDAVCGSRVDEARAGRRGDVRGGDERARVGGGGRGRGRGERVDVGRREERRAGEPGERLERGAEEVGEEGEAVRGDDEEGGRPGGRADEGVLERLGDGDRLRATSRERQILNRRGGERKREVTHDVARDRPRRRRPDRQPDLVALAERDACHLELALERRPELGDGERDVDRARDMVLAVLELGFGEGRAGRRRVQGRAVVRDDEPCVRDEAPSVTAPKSEVTESASVHAPLSTMSRTTSSCRLSYRQSIVRYGLSQSPMTPNVLNSPLWISMPFSASARAAARISCGERLEAGFLSAERALSSSGRPCVSKPGT